jgi:hypothetical protein
MHACSKAMVRGCLGWVGVFSQEVDHSQFQGALFLWIPEKVVR